MDRVLVEVYIPASELTLDMFIPRQAPMYEVLELMKYAATEMSGGKFSADANTAVCRRKDGTVLNINLSVLELGIKNGSKLMLI